MMIDWLTVVIPMKHPRIHNGHTQKISKDGELLWSVSSSQQFAGSFESSIAVKSNQLTECLQYGEMLYFSGNPTKFLQGHNVVGSLDMNMLVERTLDQIARALDFQVDHFTRHRIRCGNYYLKRVDINCMFELPSLSDVRAFIDAASVKFRTRHGRCTVTKGTFYIGKNSKRWSFKGYSKFDEIMKGQKGHRLPVELFNSPLVPFVENKLRLELVLRAPELKKITDDNNPTARQVLSLGLETIFNDYLRRIDMSANVSLKDEQLLKLPRKVQGTYALWKQGFDVRSVLANGTFYRHKDALQEFDIDISLPFDGEHTASNVVPMVRILEAQPVAIPSNLRKYIIH